MKGRYILAQSGPRPTPEKEARRRKVNPEDLQALTRRAQQWAHTGGPGRAGQHRRADAAYTLYLDFLRAGHFGMDFPRWLSRHSGIPRTTCQRCLKAGRARATGSKDNRNQTGLVAEIRERERTPGEELAWD